VRTKALNLVKVHKKITLNAKALSGLFSTVLCKSHCDFSITITNFFQQVQIERPD
jgi:hypothetical protein